MSNMSPDRVELALRMMEDSEGHVQRHVAIRADAYLSSEQARQLALQLLDMVDLMRPAGEPGLPPGFQDYPDA